MYLVLSKACCFMKSVFLFIIITTTAPLFAQTLEQKNGLLLNSDKQSILPEVDQFFGYDLYAQLYWTNKNTLYKSGSQGNFEFQELMLGPIAQVDLKNPLTVLVFYRETNTLLFLDNRLNEKRRIDFNLIEEFPQVQWVFNAGSNRLWIMDQNSQSLWVYDTQSMRVVFQSLPLPNLGELKCRYNDCIAQTSEELLWISLYGTITKRQALSTGKLMGYNQDHVLITQDEGLFDLKSNQGWYFPEIRPENQINDLQLTQDFLYIYDSNVIRRFPLKSIKQ